MASASRTLGGKSANLNQLPAVPRRGETGIQNPLRFERNVRPMRIRLATQRQSREIAEQVGFEIGMFAGSVASLTVLGDPDHILLTLSEFADPAVVADLKAVCGAPMGLSGNGAWVGRLWRREERR